MEHHLYYCESQRRAEIANYHLCSLVFFLAVNPAFNQPTLGVRPGLQFRLTALPSLSSSTRFVSRGPSLPLPYHDRYMPPPLSSSGVPLPEVSTAPR